MGQRAAVALRKGQPDLWLRTGALTLPWTTACSPKTMTFPGAETMKAGIIGLESLREAFFICDELPLV